MKNTALTSMNVHIANNRQEMGQQAAADIAKVIRTMQQSKAHLRMIFAAAPSQSEMLSALRLETGIDWQRITAFHMDEYIGLAPDAPQRFGNWLRNEFFDCVPLSSYHLINPGTDPEATCRDYANKLAEAPIDFVLLGIGANAHIAFNDPPADLDDPLAVKVVELDEICRQQQVDDECFLTLNDVPRKAITLTVPSILRGEQLFCSIPGKNKAAAVRDMMESPVSGQVPASALKNHPRCTVYLDLDSSSLLVR
jgi:glucosamine-6-phosphate deaminase